MFDWISLFLILETIKSSLVLVSYNFLGFNNSKLFYMNDLLQKCNFLLIQEHCLSNIHIDSSCNGYDSLVHEVNGFDNNQVLKGRPYGGATILLHTNINWIIEAISVNCSRIIALVAAIKNNKLLIINVFIYVSDGSVVHTNYLYDELFKIQYLVELHSDCKPVIGGDFNVDWSRDSYHTECLSDFVATHNSNCMSLNTRFIIY